MDCYWQGNNHIEIWYLYCNKAWILPFWRRVVLFSCITWTITKGLKKKIDENFIRYALAAWFYKKTAVRPLISNFTKDSSKTIQTCWVGEVKTKSQVNFSNWLQQMDSPVLTDEQKFLPSLMRIPNIFLRI